MSSKAAKLTVPVPPLPRILRPPDVPAGAKKKAFKRHRNLPEPEDLARHFAPVVQRLRDASPVTADSWQYLVTMEQVESWMPTMQDIEKNFDLMWLTVHFVPWRVPPTKFLLLFVLRAGTIGRLANHHAV